MRGESLGQRFTWLSLAGLAGLWVWLPGPGPSGPGSDWPSAPPALSDVRGNAAGGELSSVGRLPSVGWNDNQTPAGTLRDGVLTLELEVRRGVWHLLGEEEPGGEVLAFGEAGKELQIPGPMIRVPLGTEIRATVRNPLDADLVVWGLAARRVAAMDSLVVRPGESREVRFPADAEGTYYYRGRLKGSPTAIRIAEDAPLAGALIVDPPDAAGPPTDRVFVMQIWIPGKHPNGEPDFGKEFLTINGRPWPLTERFTYALGDSIRWRLINASGAVHPMHLHGFFYRVDSRGDIGRDTIYWLAQRRMAVTERMAPGTTMKIVWSPDRPGGWIFHCHNSFHVVPNPSLRPGEEETEAVRFRKIFVGHEGDAEHHAETGMGGLLLFTYIRPPEGWVPREPRRRRLRLFVQADSVPADSATRAFLQKPFQKRYAYVLQEGEREPPPDSVRLPGSPIVLWKGEPTSVTVINRTPEPTQVHWHGLEIESYFDGVAGASGYPKKLTPAIMPGDSFEMRITPPRAGSYMYHTHVSDLRQQGSGLYGAFVVLDEGEEWDPETDRILLLGLSPTGQGPQLNGTSKPGPTEFRVGTTYRLRLMNITLGNGNLRVRLVRGGAPVLWRPVAEDGWDLPAHQRALVPAERTVSIGETFDFEITPRRPGELHLEVRSGAGRLLIDRLIQVKPKEAAGDGDRTSKS
ncbi:MAG: multicopper oxidase domain-containing protein [Gemmatimonadota bacterium]